MTGPISSKRLADAIGCSIALADRWAGPLNEAMRRYEITTPQRQAAFLAQVGHESGRLRYAREIWGPTPAQARYESRADLGNVQPGDGRRYMGRGLIQITGRANYRACGAALGEDFEARPELLELPMWAALSAGWFWKSRGLNEVADKGDFERITRKINGGLNGQDDRVKLLRLASAALGAA